MVQRGNLKGNKKINIDLNEDENTMYENLWDIAKVVLRGRFVNQMHILEKMKSLKSII